MTGSLRALITRLIDYAGLFPPAALPLGDVIANYQRYLRSPESWMLNRLVLPESKLQVGDYWRITLLVNSEPGPLPPQVETLETKTAGALTLPTYQEVPIDQISDGFAKIRTGELTPEEIAEFLCCAATRKIPFKATAGLHHPLRTEAGLGFINVFVAAAFAWHGMDRREVLDVINALDGFEFLDDVVRWRGQSLTTEQIGTARRDFAHSFGSCSFEEPLDGLRQLGWLA